MEPREAERDKADPECPARPSQVPAGLAFNIILTGRATLSRARRPWTRPMVQQEGRRLDHRHDFLEIRFIPTLGPLFNLHLLCAAFMHVSPFVSLSLSPKSLQGCQGLPTTVTSISALRRAFTASESDLGKE